jgi:hypothetical protein
VPLSSDPFYVHAADLRFPQKSDDLFLSKSLLHDKPFQACHPNLPNWDILGEQDKAA